MNDQGSYLKSNSNPGPESILVRMLETTKSWSTSSVIVSSRLYSAMWSDSMEFLRGSILFLRPRNGRISLVEVLGISARIGSEVDLD